MKYVTARHLKTASNLLNPFKKSNIITQEVETDKNLTFLAYNQLLQNTQKLLSNYQNLQKTKVITQQTNRVYTKSKAVDRTLQLDFIKNLFSLRNVHNTMK